MKKLTFFLALALLYVGCTTQKPSAITSGTQDVKQLEMLLNKMEAEKKLPILHERGLISSRISVLTMVDNMGEKAYLLFLSESEYSAIRITPALGWCEVMWNTKTYEIVPWDISSGVLRLKDKKNLTIYIN